jgi:2,3-dihydroxy-2,3-dihydrophenylpropionate dehydrogenase
MQPEGRLNGVVALVTGGGSGIGRAVVERFLADGARVAVLERDAASVAALERDYAGRLVATTGDVRTPEAHIAAVERTVEVFGRLDVYVGNAGVYDFNARVRTMPMEELRDAFGEIFDTNVLGYLLGARAAAEELIRTQGSMIFTVSSSGQYAGGGGALYVASKHAVVGLVKQLAFEFAPHVRVNGVAPGATRTGLGGLSALGTSRTRLADNASQLDALSTTIPLGFVSDPVDHAGIYALLADSRDSRFMTGAVIPSDGGLEVRGRARSRDSQRRVAHE